MDISIGEILKAIGALGFFIYGMKVMSEGIQKFAGNKMRSFLSVMTSNRVLGVTTGFLITCLIQSSSATTVMVVSFVNAGLITLTESIGVIMGANIGTTLTAWLVTIFGFKVKVAAYALPIIAIGFPMLFFKKTTIKSFGEFLIGFALLFLGLQFLKEIFQSIDESQLEFLTTYADMGIWSTLLFILIGTTLTVVVQSSSAAMAITLIMVNEGWIPFEVGAAIVLGENIGTTITANLAAMIANVHAKRAARAHLIFNVFGVLWMIILFTPFIHLIDKLIVPFHGMLESINPDLVSKGENDIKLSLFHTLFNIFNTLLLLGFVNFIAKTVTKMVPSKGEDDEMFKLEYIENSAITTPELSLIEVRKELVKFLELTIKMHGFTRALLQTTDSKKFHELIAKIKKYEEITDRMEEEITVFLSKVAQHEMNEESMIKMRGYFSIASDLEHVGDSFFQISRSLERKKDKNVWFSPDQRNALMEMMDKVEKAFNNALKNLKANSDELNLDLTYEIENSVNEHRDNLQTAHILSMENEDYSYQAGMHYKDVYSANEKIADFLVNVNEALAGKI